MKRPVANASGCVVATVVIRFNERCGYAALCAAYPQNTVAHMNCVVGRVPVFLFEVQP